jgi:uncharacterized protein (TIGR00369 family)
MSTINAVISQLQKLTMEQLEQVHKGIEATISSSEGGLHAFGRFLGIEWGENEQVSMLLGVHNANTYGVAQGGALYSLADIAIGYYILKRLPPEEQVFTLEMKMNFIKKGIGNRLYAVPRILHWGRTTVVADCEIIDEEQNMVAMSLGTFYLVKKERHS